MPEERARKCVKDHDPRAEEEADEDSLEDSAHSHRVSHEPIGAPKDELSRGRERHRRSRPSRGKQPGAVNA